MSGRSAGLATLLLIAACASPRERAFQAALKDYNRMNRAAVEFARDEVKQLVAATQAFQATDERWPQTFEELAQFAFSNKLALDPAAFNDVAFAALPNNTVQVHYDVNCARFNTPQCKFTQSGSVNVKAK